MTVGPHASALVPGGPAAPWRWWLGPVAVVAAFSVVVMAVTLAGAVAGSTAVADFADDYPQWAGVIQDSLWLAVVIAVPLLAARHLRAGQLGLRASRPRRFAVALATALAAFYAFSAVYSWAAGLTEESNTLLRDTGIGESVGGDLGYVLLFAVLAPVAEELLFRGLLFATLATKLGAWPAAIASGAFFGAIHLGNGQDAFIPVLIALGVILALAYHYSGTLYVPIAAHAVNNALATGSSSNLSADWLTALLVLSPLLAVGLAWILARVITATLPQRPRAPGQVSR